MEELRELLELQVNDRLQQIIISNPRQKGGVKKIHIRPILLQNKVCYQVANYTEKQVFHENLGREDAITKILRLMEEFKQLQLNSSTMTATVLISKKGTTTIKKKAVKSIGGNAEDLAPSEVLSHNRKRNTL